jgi:hypothetical protein
LAAIFVQVSMTIFASFESVGWSLFFLYRGVNDHFFFFDLRTEEFYIQLLQTLLAFFPIPLLK